MSPFFDYFLPPLCLGTIVGVIAGTFSLRRPARRSLALAIGCAASIALACLWHGPFGGADRLTVRINRGIAATLDYYEVRQQVTAHLHHDPLTRRVMLAGKADDFQRSELVRLMSELKGVSGATWSNDGGGVPLIVEGSVVAVLGFLLGLLLAYLVELRRRYNAQWNW
jgi:hypothetical protein